jgi:hypothetical protein
MFVHVNAFRCPFRRLAGVGGTDLAGPGQRFAAMLQRVMPRSD